ncbi:phospholipase A2 inhibitor and Ly6/PLAUR domain-containing protein-like [Hyperolius riggenbachi]|uniref:phospholipase A2 inhibitor and Ly6/PLAUR domain-containing protein-like n=1 Tax=Hyperolius riggenbachi TaxID=752182 RepID=UPI0035A3CD91
MLMDGGVRRQQWMWTGYSVTCYECFDKTTTSCTGVVKECDSGICMSGLISLFGDGTLFGRSCAPSEASCGVSGTMTSPKGVAKISTSCCKTSNCTPAALRMPVTSTNINGMVCPLCDPPTSETCKMICTGYERRCGHVEFRNSRPLQDINVNGCATDSFCSFENQTFDISGVVFHLGIVCGSVPTAHLQHFSFFLSLVLVSDMMI